MAFDSEILVTAPTASASVRERDLSVIGMAADPDENWASIDPERLMAYLYVSPRPCAALDALIAQAQARA